MIISLVYSPLPPHVAADIVTEGAIYCNILRTINICKLEGPHNNKKNSVV
jgi:hypothetical protein